MSTKEKTPVQTAYVDYDEFWALIQKSQVENPYTPGQSTTIITGWKLIEKIRFTRIEPHLAKELNSFANGMDNQSGDGGRGKIYLPKGKYNSGDVLSYEEWATEQGKNLKKDANILLKQFLND